ncbi:MAG: hypothetical protein ABL891_13910 [Burkholderiales bacterium]
MFADASGTLVRGNASTNARYVLHDAAKHASAVNLLVYDFGTAAVTEFLPSWRMLARR